MIKMYRNTYVEIDVQQIKENIKNIIKKNSDYKYYFGVVKGNAYGHGMEISKWIIEAGINYLAVSTIEEALVIREKISKDIPILILQPINLDYVNLCIKNKLTIIIDSYDNYLKLKKMDVKGLKVHIKIDSGMNRLGFNNEEQVRKVYQDLIDSDTIQLEGIFTHLATLGITDNRFDKQIKRFLELTQNIDLSKIEIVHLYSSNGIAIHPKLPWANGVRLGIIMYGLGPRNLPTEGLKNKLRARKRNIIRKYLNLSEINGDFNIDVKPALKLISKVDEVKEVNKDDYIGYGLHYKAHENITIAIVPVGYMDGLSLHNSGRFVYINNKPYKIVGTVNMGMIAVKVDNSVKVGDCVEVIKNLREEILYTKTTPHEYLTRISPLLERKYIAKEK